MRRWGPHGSPTPATLRLVALATTGWLLVANAGSAVAHDGHGESTAPAPSTPVGLLIADHGEPPVYDENTYWSFREFVEHLMAIGVIPRWLRTVDAGTMLFDADCPGCERRPSPRLIDAWLRPHEGPAVFVPAADRVPAHYVVPGGPGLGEPDVFELAGLTTWDEWRRMGGRSPNYDEKLPRKQAVVARLRAAYGQRLAIRVGYLIDPRIGGTRQGIRDALRTLVNRDRVGALVVAYDGVGFSDIMQTHHLRHLVAEELEALGAARLPVRFAAPLGTQDAYVDAVVDKVREEIAAVPPTAPLAVHLSGHGLPTGRCGDYDCGADAYHRSAADLFTRVRPAVEAALRARPGPSAVFHVYGDGGDGEDDPADRVDSPTEALAERAAAGFTHVVDVPYEFAANSRDTLIVLRRGYGRTPPDWGPDLRSRFRWRGLQVTIANASGGDGPKIAALESAVRDALAGWLSPAAATTPAQHSAAHPAPVDAGSHGAPEGSTPVHLGREQHAAGDPTDAAVVSVRHPAGHDGTGSEREVGGATGWNHAGVAETHGHAATASRLAPLAAVVTAAAITAARQSRRRARAVLLAGGTLQLAGLAWDLAAHWRAGEPVGLAENGGHVTFLAGLAATVSVAAFGLRHQTRP